MKTLVRSKICAREGGIADGNGKVSRGCRRYRPLGSIDRCPIRCRSGAEQNSGSAEESPSEDGGSTVTAAGANTEIS